MKCEDMPIKEIKSWLESVNYLPDDIEVNQLEKDLRSGIRPLLARIYRKREEQRALQEQWWQMNEYERALRSKGYSYIAGIDEVGRGPLAGPVVSAAVILPEDFYLPGLNDSKQLSQETREVYYDDILHHALEVGIAMISNEEIDQLNILNATKLSMQKALEQLTTPVDHLLVDALTLEVSIPQTPVIGGDAKSVSIAAASVVAKVTRDRWMSEIANKYPQYGFERNVGYGTKEHREAIARFGITPIHRKSFAGVKEWMEFEKVGN